MSEERDRTRQEDGDSNPSAVPAVEEPEIEILAFDDDGAQEAPAAAAAEGGDLLVEPQTEVARLEREISDLRDRTLRTLADFDNYRKRAERERQEIKRYALLEALRDLLPVVDNLERALSASGQGEELRQGVELILKQLRETLQRHGVREVPTAGERFDPTVHEAVSRQQQEGVAEPTVKEVLQRGYLLHERLLRPSMVVVEVPLEGSDSARERSQQ